MVIVIRVNKRDVDRVRKRLKREEMKVQQVIKSEREWGQVLVRDIKSSAKLAGIQSFTGRLQGRGVRWEQKGSTGELLIDRDRVYLDSMKPHFVNIQKSRGALVQWGKQAINPEVRRVSKAIESGRVKKYGIQVKPHPFIRDGFNRAIPKLDMIIRKNIHP